MLLKIVYSGADETVSAVLGLLLLLVTAQRWVSSVRYTVPEFSTMSTTRKLGPIIKAPA